MTQKEKDEKEHIQAHKDLIQGQRDLIKMVIDISARLFAIQTLLQERDVFSAADVDQRTAHLREQFPSEEYALLIDKLRRQSEESERRLALLESHEGTKQ